jgi:hypothetical protein
VFVKTLGGETKVVRDYMGLTAKQVMGVPANGGAVRACSTPLCTGLLLARGRVQAALRGSRLLREQDHALRPLRT